MKPRHIITDRRPSTIHAVRTNPRAFTRNTGTHIANRHTICLGTRLANSHHREVTAGR
jgi:hypothetical protein